MSYKAEVYMIMIASPGDVDDERNIIREVLYEWNVVYSKVRNIVLLPVAWETHSSPEMGDRAQAIINKQLSDCDLLIGVFWTRIGTATGEYPSGSVEEIQRHIDAKKPVMLYFSSALINPEAVDSNQYSELKKFKQSCQSNGLCENYSSLDDFKSKLNRQLQLKLNLEPFTEISQSYSETKLAVRSDVPDISEEDNKVLAAVYRTALRTGKRYFNLSEMSSELDPLGIMSEDITDSLQMLDGRGYIRTERGGGQVFAIWVTGIGFLDYINKFAKEYYPVFEAVGDQIVNKSAKKNIEIAKSLEQPLIVVDLIIEYLEKLGHLRVSRYADYQIEIHKTSVELKRAFKKT